jgi:hypothetical protein
LLNGRMSVTGELHRKWSLPSLKQCPSSCLERLRKATLFPAVTVHNTSHVFTICIVLLLIPFDIRSFWNQNVHKPYLKKNSRGRSSYTVVRDRMREDCEDLPRILGTTRQKVTGGEIGRTRSRRAYKFW